jgi:hypothetical protein
MGGVMSDLDTVLVRYIVHDVDAAIEFYAGRNRISLPVADLEDPSGNPVELFQPTR